MPGALTAAASVFFFSGGGLVAFGGGEWMVLIEVLRLCIHGVLTGRRAGRRAGGRRTLGGW